MRGQLQSCRPLPQSQPVFFPPLLGFKVFPPAPERPGTGAQTFLGLAEGSSPGGAEVMPGRRTCVGTA